ncbi:MAG TPA: hypothetical protein G4O08_05160 [Anaerolineae bacterium]|nr:hypothetical protein [Anaerolineae bacterium]
MIPPTNNRLKLVAMGLVLISMVFAVLSCDLNDLIGNGELSPEDQAATGQSLLETEIAGLTGATDTPEPTEIPLPLDCSGATFNLDPAIAASVTAQTIPAEAGDPMMTFTIHPEYVEYSFTGYALSNTFHEPKIRIYPVDEFVAMVPYVGNIVADLNQLLLNAPSPPTDGIPFLPIWNAAQMIHAKESYLSFQNGSGIRFLSQYGQAYWLINNHDLFYTYQGLTSDEACYVSAIFPVSNPALPNEGAPPPGETEAEIIAYYDTIVPQLNALDDTTFLPPLGTLDALIASLLVQ